MKFPVPITVLAASCALALVPASSALAQRQPPTPEQRIQRLERQVEEVQRRVFPKGRPADTAGFAEDPAATQSSVMGLAQRIDALERQLTDLVRQTEENGSRLRNVETALGQLRRDEEERITAIEQRLEAAATAAPLTSGGPSSEATTASPPASKPKPAANPPKTSVAAPQGGPASGEQLADAAAPSDPGEDAYSEGFHLWEDGQYDEAIKSLRSFVAAYPKHRRVSFANNLIGRAQLDSGQARAATETLLANYRNNPGGERAADSLYYLGQALMKLNQPTQACNAYAELDAVYGAKIRPELKTLETQGKVQANCR